MIVSKHPLCATAIAIWVCATSCTTGNAPSSQRQGARPAEVQSTSSPRFDPAKYEKLALIVQDLTDTRSPDPALARQVEDIMAQALFSKGYRLATRSDIESVMKEITLQTSGLTDSDASRVGRLLNVPSVLIVGITGKQVEMFRNNTINLFESLARPNAAKISARLVEVESAEWLWIASHSGSSTLSVAQDIANAFPARPR